MLCVCKQLTTNIGCFYIIASASSLFGSHKATEPIDGKREHNTCFWSESKVSSWWQLDIGQEKLIKKIRIINMVELMWSDVFNCVVFFDLFLFSLTGIW